MTASHSGPYFVDGTPPINGIIAINYGVVSTPFLAVSLNSLYASDPSSGLSQMRFSSNNSTWSPFESYSANKFGWDLSQYGGNINYGIKTVYVKFRDNAGNESISYFDDIQYISGISPEVFLQDIAVSSGQSSCYNATETVNIAGNGTTFIVQNGGIAIIIAGQNIHFLSGTFGKQGGYLHGYITTDDQYCGGQPNTMITKTIESIEIPVSNLRQSNFKTYPNPTTGNFILELPGDLQTKKIQVDIFGMRGEMVLTATLNGERKHEFSLSDKPTGVYFIRIVSGDKTETLKIIKQ